MPTPIKWKDLFQANVNDAATGIQVDPRVVGLSNGLFLVVWTEAASGTIGSGAGSNLIAQRFDQFGTRVNDPFQVNTLSTIDDERDCDIAATSDGGFVIVYVDDDISSANQTGIVWQRHNANAVVIESKIITVENVAADFVGNPQVAVNLLTNLSLITFTRNVGTDTDVRAVTVTSAGDVSAEFDAAQNGSDFNGDGDVAILAGGLYVSVYREADGAVTSAEARIMSSTGAVVVTFNLTTEPVESARVATLANGNWVAAWTETGGGNSDIRYQVFTPTGTPVSTTLFAAAGANNQHSPDVVALPDGGFVIVWDDDTGGEILARRFGPDGAGDGTLFTVASGADSVPDAAATGDGRILFTWKDGETAEIFASIWDPREGEIVASDYQDQTRNFVRATAVTARPTGTAMTAEGTIGAVLFGMDGDDVLTGDNANHFLVGSLGNDTYLVNGAAVVTEFINQGRDVVYASVSYTLGAGQEIEVLSTVSQAAGTAINLTGNGIFNEVYGNAGDNVIDGGGGSDYLQGYAGNDIYFVDHGSDLVVETAGGGRDVIYTNVNFTLGANSEIEVLSTSSSLLTTPLELTGNGLFNEIYGNAGANIIDGGGGPDYLRGYGGNDIYLINHGSDYIFEIAGEGTRDVVYARVSFTLAAGVDIEVLSVASQGPGNVIDLTGNELANELYGNAEANYLDGGAGADYLQGYGGNDSYVVETQGDIVIEGAGEGTRDVVFARASYTLGAGQQIEVLSAISSGATTAIDLTGNALANELYGNAGANVLNGGLGADYLLGFAGADSFAFTTALGGGNVDQVGDFVSGTDKILLDDAVFTGLTAGALPAGAFVTGAAAADADDRIVYNSATGQLFFDADGSGAGVAVQFATLGTGLTLAASDFLVI